MSDAGHGRFADALRALFAPERSESIRELTADYWRTHTGSKFEELSDGPPDMITERDLIAVSMLGVHVPAGFAIWVLSDPGRSEVSGLLRDVPTDVDIWDRPDLVSPDAALWRLWDVLSTGCWPEPVPANDMGPTTISKLLATKRPRLVPITDSVVTALLPPVESHWLAFADALSDADLRGLVDAASPQPEGRPAVALLRRLDVALWRIGKDPALSRY
jgi:hypothetical protein